MELSLRADDDSPVTVLEVGGEVDAYSAPTLGARISEIVASGQKQLVVDLNGVEFIDSTGLGVLVGGFNEAREAGGRLDLVCAVERVLKLLRITGLNDVFTITSTVSEALAGIAGK
ncbi:MAG TPA: STAS domain-containing protein [Mycobacteriales bacterium]|nr:STAS domain-containing protein [Mycobacteriales bacterium]